MDAMSHFMLCIPGELGMKQHPYLLFGSFQNYPVPTPLRTSVASLLGWKHAYVTSIVCAKTCPSYSLRPSCEYPVVMAIRLPIHRGHPRFTGLQAEARKITCPRSKETGYQATALRWKAMAWPQGMRRTISNKQANAAKAETGRSSQPRPRCHQQHPRSAANVRPLRRRNSNSDPLIQYLLIRLIIYKLLYYCC